MKIAFISSLYQAPWGGSEELWHKTAIKLSQMGHTVMASVKKWPERPQQLNELLGLGVDVDERQWIGASRLDRIKSKLMRREITHPGFDPSWQKIMDFQPHLVCISQGGSFDGYEWMLKCRNHNLKYVTIAEVASESLWPDDDMADHLADLLENACKTYFVTSENRRLVERQIAQNLSNAEVIFNPFNVSWNASPAWPADGANLKLACVARIDPQHKGQDILFQILALPKWKNRDITVSLFGGGRIRSFKRLAEMFGIQNKVKIHGHVSDIEAIWRDHHALVLPSRFEGLPLALVETMLCGRTSIVSNVAGIDEIVEDNVTGFIAQSATVMGIDEAMERAWQKRNDWFQLGQNAANSIRKKIPEDPSLFFAQKLLSLI